MALGADCQYSVLSTQYEHQLTTHHAAHTTKGRTMKTQQDRRQAMPDDMNLHQPPPGEQAARWAEHEHVAEPVQEQARKLVEEAGSKELAKQAIDNTDRPSALRPSSRDEFAQQLGFASYLELFEASQPLRTEGEKRWCATAVEDRWIVWNDQDLQASRPFDSAEAAAASVTRGPAAGP
jgi:hypothetical protein